MSKFWFFNILTSCSIFVVIQRTFFPNNNDNNDVRNGHNNQWNKIQWNKQEVNIALDKQRRDQVEVANAFDWHSNFPHQIDFHKLAYRVSFEHLENTIVLKHMTLKSATKLKNNTYEQLENLSIIFLNVLPMINEYRKAM